MTFGATATATTAPVHLRIVDKLENTGNRALTYLDVELPASLSPAKKLNVQIDGKPVTPMVLTVAPDSPWRVSFDPLWPQGQPREIAFDYDLVAHPIDGGVASVTPEGFYLADPDAYPFWLKPVGIFANSDFLQRDERFEITLPADYRVLASGKRQQRKAPDGSAIYDFRTSGESLPSFVVAGRYQEQTVSTPDGDVVFWTFRPLDSAVAQAAARRLAAAQAAFVTRFGPFPGAGQFRVVEAPAGLLVPDPAAPDAPSLAASFPQGLLLSSLAFDRGLASEPVLRIAEAEMARIWFGWTVPLDSDTETLFGRGFGFLAVATSAGARGGDSARRDEIARLLAEYDRARPAGGDGSLLLPPAESTPEQLVANSLKGALFLAALEDRAGKDKFQEAIRRLQTAMTDRGLSLSLKDVRSALEFATGTSMADVFRQWINQPGVPNDFRARYRGASSSSTLPPRTRSSTLNCSDSMRANRKLCHPEAVRSEGSAVGLLPGFLQKTQEVS
jgi:hypothetical protein